MRLKLKPGGYVISARHFIRADEDGLFCCKAHANMVMYNSGTRYRQTSEIFIVEIAQSYVFFNNENS